MAPEGWTMYTHPRGSIYFWNPSHKVIVDEDIRAPAHLENANAFCSQQHRAHSLGDIEAYMAYGGDASVPLFVNHIQCVAGYDRSKVVGSAVRDLSVDAC